MATVMQIILQPVLFGSLLATICMEFSLGKSNFKILLRRMWNIVKFSRMP
jgi:hypothetical protein